MKRYAFVVFLLAAAGSVWWLTEGMKKRRFPASADNQYDLSRLEPESFSATAVELITTTTRLKEVDKHLYEISFAHFLGPEPATSICSSYENIQLTFTAEGVAVGGEPPQIHLEYDCAATPSAERMQPILIDVKAISEVNPKSEQYPVTDVYAYGSHMDDFWPLEWYLSNVRLIDETDQTIEATASDFRKIRGDVLRLQFP